MLSDQLIRIIESHAEELTRGTVEVLQSSVQTPAYHALSPNELHDRIFEIYHNLGHWLLGNTDQSIQDQYEQLGKQRFKEGVPLAQLLWALVLIKEHLRDSIGNFMSADSALELHRERELFRLMGRFFDRALCYTAEAYGREASRQAAAAKATHDMDHTVSSLYRRLLIH